eukprot:TRINITY_DN15638_c0_g1_i3.p2 TRINITY_DN15638_c0_g1~~TRINITY_DN15638_c0_g1_i3.p2  ORF type:complete len:172 (+),score=41.46 TRINITY_DN15638_c0_g1_i3:228-743(+)
MSGEMVAAVPPAALDGLSQIQCWPGNAEQSASPKKTDVTIALVSPEQPAKRRRVGRPRKLEPEWHTTASRTELVRCFLWEVGQGFKHHFINNISFNSRKLVFTQDYTKVVPKEELELTALEHFAPPIQRYIACLLYTSDAADEEDSVDLGGRRIIKKKKSRGVTQTRRNKK